MNKHFIIYEYGDYHTNGCDCCEPMDFNYYNFEDEEVAKYSGSITDINNIPIELAAYLGYTLPDHLDDYDECNEYAEIILATLGVTYEIKQGGNYELY